MKKATDMKRAFSITELVVVIAIIAILLALTLVGVQAARASARRAGCINNLRQLSLSGQNYASAINTLPSGGWGRRWMGYSGGGAGKSQPGGWAYSLLPYLDNTNIFEMVANQNDMSNRSRVESFALEMPALYACPARSHRREISVNPTYKFYGTQTIEKSQWSSYAINAGTFFYVAPFGPRSFSEAYRYAPHNKIDGVSWYRSELKLGQIQDGLSHTIFVGERWVGQEGVHFDHPVWAGDCLDLHRFTQEPPRPNSVSLPHSNISFGSDHTQGVVCGICDGSVRLVSYQVDPIVFLRLGNRRDGFASAQ